MTSMMEPRGEGNPRNRIWKHFPKSSKTPPPARGPLSGPVDDTPSADGAEKLPQYASGYSAFKDGAMESDCPHKDGVGRIAWFCGYFTARTQSRLGHVFERAGIQFP